MKVLVVAPHPDDEILGAGATMAKHVAEGDTVYVCVATKGAAPLYSEEGVAYIREELKKAHKIIGVTESFFIDFPAVMMEEVERYKINGKMQDLINQLTPDIIYMPHFGDMQKDHSMVAESVMVAVRPKQKHKVKAVYAYETLSETEWNIPHTANSFIPNVYNDVSDFIDTKIKALRCYQSQLSPFPNPRSEEAVLSLAKYRGSTVLVKAAEAFMLIREVK